MQPTPITTPRYGGDKLAFKPGGTTNPHENGAIVTITEIIKAAREKKRAVKKEIEQEKEDGIEAAEMGATKELKELEAMFPKPSEIEMEVKRKKIVEKKITQSKQVLYAYHAKVLKDGGWHWREIKQTIMATNFDIPVSVDEVQSGPESGVAFVRSGASGAILYTISFGRSRFTYDTDQAGEAVYRKVGTTADVRKEYVADRNGVMTRRFVTRAITIYHVANMFGIKITPPPRVPHPEDAKLRKVLPKRIADRICREIDDVTADPTVEVAFDEKGDPLAEQLPRYRDPAYGAHADVFDIRRAASYEPDSQLNPDFVPYRARGVVELSVGEKTKLSIVSGFCAERVRTDPMYGNERASMQVRNGTGPVQPYLSTASIQIIDVDGLQHYPDKVIRANKGERFDTGAENQATVLVDLAIAKKLGVDIVNQHAVESDRHKIAFDRYYDKNNIAALERRVAHKLFGRREDGTLFKLSTPLVDDWLRRLHDARVSEPLKANIDVLAQHAALVPIWPWDLGIGREEFGTLSYDAINKIMGLRGNEVDHTQEKIGRRAAGELDEYIYSARKNREVLMDRIPVACVTHIKLNDEPGKWAGFEHLTTWQPGVWYGFGGGIEAALRSYLSGMSGTDYANVKEMFKKAAVDKQNELDRT